MSTQDSATQVPFTTAHSQQPFKLLELPPALLALLESDNPPTLYLTSGTPHAILSTPTETYRIQQKNTSNPLMLLRPSTTDRAEGVDADAIPCASVCAIAKIEDTLELLPHDPSVAAAVAPTKVNKWHEKFAASRAAKK